MLTAACSGKTFSAVRRDTAVRITDAATSGKFFLSDRNGGFSVGPEKLEGFLVGVDHALNDRRILLGEILRRHHARQQKWSPSIGVRKDDLAPLLECLGDSRFYRRGDLSFTRLNWTQFGAECSGSYKRVRAQSKAGSREETFLYDVRGVRSGEGDDSEALEPFWVSESRHRPVECYAPKSNPIEDTCDDDSRSTFLMRNRHKCWIALRKLRLPARQCRERLRIAAGGYDANVNSFLFEEPLVDCDIQGQVQQRFRGLVENDLSRWRRSRFGGGTGSVEINACSSQHCHNQENENSSAHRLTSSKRPRFAPVTERGEEFAQRHSECRGYSRGSIGSDVAFTTFDATDIVPVQSCPRRQFLL